MMEFLNERNEELIELQREAVATLSEQLLNEYPDQSLVQHITSRIQKISGQIEEIKYLKRQAKRKEMKERK